MRSNAHLSIVAGQKMAGNNGGSAIGGPPRHSFHCCRSHTHITQASASRLPKRGGIATCRVASMPYERPSPLPMPRLPPLLPVSGAPAAGNNGLAGNFHWTFRPPSAILKHGPAHHCPEGIEHTARERRNLHAHPQTLRPGGHPRHLLRRHRQGDSGRVDCDEVGVMAEETQGNRDKGVGAVVGCAYLHTRFARIGIPRAGMHALPCL